MASHEYVEELIRRSDIVDIVGNYVQLKRKGRLYGGLCPFHNEKTPSFYVYPETQSFYCFGCGAGGDVITFIKKISSLSYGEAVKLLAERAGMPEPDEDDGTGRMRSRILSMNKEAARFFHACLNSSVDEAAQARAYWRRRGLDDRTIARFGLGYAPDNGQALYQHLRDKGYTQAEMDASGLFKRSPSGRIYCLFWRRVMTPIFDLRGNVIAFGGRVLDDSKPKYVNSPETLVYHKSETVFALQIAKRSASRRYVLCEGYGQKATLRSLELFRNSPVQVGVLNIPNAKDPDEYIKKFGAERFQQLLDSAGNAMDFRLARARAKYDLSQDSQRLGYIQEAVEILADGSTPTEKELYAGRLAEETNIAKTAILAQVDGVSRKLGARRRSARRNEILHSGEMDTLRVPYDKSGPGALGMASSQRRLVAAALRQPEYLKKIAPALRPESILNPELREGYQAMLQCYQEGHEVSLGALAQVIGEKAMNELSGAAAEYSDVSCTPQDVEMYLERIARGEPLSARAADKSVEELTDYLAQMSRRKGGGQPEEE